MKADAIEAMYHTPFSTMESLEQALIACNHAAASVGAEVVVPERERLEKALQDEFVREALLLELIARREYFIAKSHSSSSSSSKKSQQAPFVGSMVGPEPQVRYANMLDTDSE